MNTHIITQIRSAFKTLLASADGIGVDRVHNYSRIASGFQSDQYPQVVILVTDTLTESDVENRIDTLSISVSFKISVRTSISNPEDQVDALRLSIQKALDKRGDLGFGRYWDWRVESLSAPQFEPIDDEGKAFAIVAVLPVSFSIKVPTGDYTKNFNP